MVFRTVFVLVILLAAGAYAADLRSERTEKGSLPDIEMLPRQSGDWRSEDFPIPEIEAEVLDADLTLSRRFTRSDGTNVWLFFAYFEEQQVNSQIHSPRNCLIGEGWSLVELEKRDLDIGSRRRSMTCMTIGNRGRTSQIYYSFRTRGGNVAGEYGLKWDLVKSSIARRPTDAAFIRYSGSDDVAIRELMGALDEPLDRMLNDIGLP